MIRRYLYDTFLSHINKKKQQIYYFQIGCFPSSEENLNHELPISLIENIKLNYNLEYNLILLDPFYKKNKLVNKKLDNINYYIYDELINKEKYNILLEFFFLLIEFRHLVIIMEFTSIQRIQYYNKKNINENLYITESECITNTNNIFHKPLITYNKEKNKYEFLRFKLIKNLYEYFQSCNDNSKKYIEVLIKNNFRKIKNLYIKVLRYMNIEIKYDNKIIKNEYNKKNKYIYFLYNKLLERMNNNFECHYLIEDFKISNYDNLENYINNIIFNILVDLYKYLGETNINNVIFNNIKKLDKNINYFTNILG